ncbi:hypothetical protein OB955_04800 [Halobacteria archaeon AArc-m2/3/4]|uniref:Carboxypeptidase regulatory-like domain-containing protein n=1 Tax=Natronoglomus mannanivorans TaxID=2979990 RepID=A0ABT2QAU1_9EURY|nr:hypothetical protein [Halobacteria archaeon AArc-m2/3/4]
MIRKITTMVMALLMVTSVAMVGVGTVSAQEIEWTTIDTNTHDDGDVTLTLNDGEFVVDWDALEDGTTIVAWTSTDGVDDVTVDGSSGTETVDYSGDLASVTVMHDYQTDGGDWMTDEWDYNAVTEGDLAGGDVDLTTTGLDTGEYQVSIRMSDGSILDRDMLESPIDTTFTDVPYAADVNVRFQTMGGETWQTDTFDFADETVVEYNADTDETTVLTGDDTNTGRDDPEYDDDDPAHDLDVTVEDDSGTAIDNADVTVDGEADWDALENGDYLVTADAEGYISASEDVTIDGDDASVTLTLVEEGEDSGDDDTGDDDSDADDGDNDDSDGDEAGGGGTVDDGEISSEAIIMGVVVALVVSVIMGVFSKAAN